MKKKIRLTEETGAEPGTVGQTGEFVSRLIPPWSSGLLSEQKGEYEEKVENECTKQKGLCAGTQALSGEGSFCFN